MAAVRIIYLPAKPAGTSVRKLGWLPNSTQPPAADAVGWLNRRKPAEAAEAVESQPDRRGWLYSNQPNRAETRAWKHPDPGFEKPEGEPAENRTQSRFLGPQPAYAERAPWRHPPVDPGDYPPFERPSRGWFAGLPNASQVVIEHAPWRHRVEIPETVPVEPGNSNPWRPGFVAHTQVVTEYLTWRHPPTDQVKAEGEPADLRSWARFLGPQPGYREFAPWRHPPLRFEWPEAETAWRGGWAYLPTPTPPSTTATPGGVFRRAAWSWPRVFRRAASTWCRVWRYKPMTVNPIPPVTLVKPVDEPRWMAVSLKECPEVVAGETLSSPELLPTGGPTGVTISILQVLAAPFDGIPAGQGVMFFVEGGTAGSVYNFAIRVTASGGGKPIVPCRLAVPADYAAA